MKKILFVDDNLEMLQSLKRLLRKMRNDWDMTFVDSGRDALKLMAANHFDVIVTDLRMPDVNGLKVLKYVQKNYPHMVRIILSGEIGKNAGIQLAALAHQFLAKPVEPDNLIKAIQAQNSISELVFDKNYQKVISQIQSLPSFPSLYSEFMNELNDEDSSSERVGQIITRDMAMSAKILQLVNSAFFGLPQYVSSPAQAAVLLGTETIRDLYFSLKVFSQFDIKKLIHFGLVDLWKHSFEVGIFSKIIAKTMGLERKVADSAFTSGLLHDIGKLVLAENFPDEYKKTFHIAKRKHITRHKAEYEVMGIMHGKIGAYLLGLWGLPTPVVEATAYHHEVSQAGSDKFNLIVIVHIANGLDHEFNKDHTGIPVSEMDMEYVSQLGLESEIPLFRKNCLENMDNIGVAQ
ncbi:MAG: HDOD domain-containing protein [Anaerolineaceae bacterium]|nr:HDOD domain-containing protein [Anaerolineaceae bacterium]